MANLTGNPLLSHRRGNPPREGTETENLIMIARMLAVLAFLSLASAAQAQNVWSAPGSACVPTSSTIGHHLTGLSYVRHAAGETGNVEFMCQIDRFNNGTTTWNLRATYRDSTGADTSAAVLVRLYRMAIGTATPVLISQANSNGSASTGTSVMSSPEFTHTFDFEANT